VAGSALAAAALFSPLRRWVRRWWTARLTGHANVAVFAARVQGPVDLDTSGMTWPVLSTGPWKPIMYLHGSASPAEGD
jgi:hypothetical protein